MAPTEKLRSLKSLRSTTGCASVSSHIRKKTKATKARQASRMMVGLANQSSSLPLSSMICSAPTQTTNSARPTLSMGSLRVTDSRSP
ncbi:hypothetical protein AD428_02170 [Achromobacter sp. DMS1]|nr:hypothetical protein AD428_02170 [Achromobacter sp. DMS1]